MAPGNDPPPPTESDGDLHPIILCRYVPRVAFLWGLLIRGGGPTGLAPGNDPPPQQKAMEISIP